MKYEDISNLDINKRVAMRMFCGFKEIRPSTSGGDSIYVDSGLSEFYDFYDGEFDYCNNPSDIMPIAIKYGISSVYMGDYWSTHGLNEELGNDEDWASESCNLYRAIAICFLKMMDAKNEQ